MYGAKSGWECYNCFHGLCNNYNPCMVHLCSVKITSQIKPARMKLLMMVFACMLCFCFGGGAQSAATSVNDNNKSRVCRPAQGQKGAACYNTKFAENYRVCKNERGYYICSAVSGTCDSSFLKFIGVYENTGDLYENQYTLPANKNAVDDKTVPQSQSYSNTPAGSH